MHFQKDEVKSNYVSEVISIHKGCATKNTEDPPIQ